MKEQTLMNNRDTKNTQQTAYSVQLSHTAWRGLLAVAILWLVIGVTAQDATTFALPPAYSARIDESSSIELTQAGRIISTQPLMNTASVVGLDRSIEQEYVLAGANGVTILPDGLQALAVGRDTLLRIDLVDGASETIASFSNGDGAFVVADDDTAYISLPQQAQILAVNLADPTQQYRIDTPPQPTGLALWGDFLYVTHFWTGELSVIAVNERALLATMRPDDEASLATGIAIDDLNGRAYLPQSLSNTHAALPDNRMVPVVQVIDLATFTVERTINLIVVDRYVNQPVAATLNQNSRQLVVAHKGSSSITILDVTDGLASAHIEIEGYSAPHGIAYNRAFTEIALPLLNESAVAVYGIRFADVRETLTATTPPLLLETQLGAGLFNQAPQHVSCANCHANGTSDGRRWNDILTPALTDTIFDAAFIAQHAQQQTGQTITPDSFEMTALMEYLRRLNTD